MRVFVNSIPKSGTNLLEKLVRFFAVKRSGKSIAYSSIEGRHSFFKHIFRINHFYRGSIPLGLELPAFVSQQWLKGYMASVKPGTYFSGHAAYSEQLDYMLKSESIKSLQIYRDPRAILVSWAKYVAEDINSWYPFHSSLKKMELSERILFLLHGGEMKGLYHSSFKEVLQRSGGWLDSTNTLVVRFEDLVGAKGGGVDGVQRESIAAILKHIGKDYRDEELDVIQNKLYGGTHTFRSGRIDSWKESIDDNLNILIIHSLKDCHVLKKLGYTDFL